MYIGIDLGGTAIKAGIVDENGKIIAKDSVSTRAGAHYSEIVADMAAVAKQVCKKSEISTDKIEWIGVGSPGVCDRKTGTLIYTNNINFNDVPMRAEMQKHIDIPMFLDNDANCAALGELVCGATFGVENAVFVTLGTGVGGGVIINRKIYSGTFGAAAELGHMAIHGGGAQCTCGRKGCWEAYASVTALIAQTKAAAQGDQNGYMWKSVGGDLNKIGGRTAFDAMRAGDSLAAQVVDTYITHVAEGVANIVNIFDPEIIAVGGGLSNEGDTLIVPLAKKVDSMKYCKQLERGAIRRASLGNDAGLIGAALLGKYQS